MLEKVKFELFIFLFEGRKLIFRPQFLAPFAIAMWGEIVHVIRLLRALALALRT